MMPRNAAVLQSLQGAHVTLLELWPFANLRAAASYFEQSLLFKIGTRGLETRGDPMLRTGW